MKLFFSLQSVEGHMSILSAQLHNGLIKFSIEICLDGWVAKMRDEVK
jgi:hypothetical protein